MGNSSLFAPGLYRAMWPLIALLAVPLAEIAGFVIVGRMIGLLPTLGLVVLSGFAGIAILRTHGLRVAAALAGAARSVRGQGEALADGAIVAIAAVLLIVPGFISDVLGLVLLVPSVRRALVRRVARNAAVRPAAGAVIIDADYEVVEPRGPRIIDTEEDWRGRH